MKLFCYSLVVLIVKLVFQVTEASEKMALSVEQLTSDRRMLESQVSRGAFPVGVRIQVTRL